MRILITTHQLAAFAGSEIYTFELAKGLKRAGHTVTVYSRYVDAFEYLFQAEGIELVSDLSLLADRQFDVAHVQHNINAMEVRLAFPRLPIFFLSHSDKTFLERIPSIDVNITLFGAVSQRVKICLTKQGVKKSKISIVNNIVDDTQFFPQQPIHEKPEHALIISNRMDEKTAKVIARACAKRGIKLTGVGKSFRPISSLDIPKAINQADIVFTIGRGVIETMMCGRVPFVFDYAGGDGLITKRNYTKSAEHHFNGQYKHKHFTVNEVIKELKKYDASLGDVLHARAKSDYATSVCVATLESIYMKTIAQYKYKKVDRALLSYIVETVAVTRVHTFSRSEQSGLVAKVRNLRNDMPLILRTSGRSLKSRIALPTVGVSMFQKSITRA